jgi:polyisoprenoid-binding protein YceI
MVGQEPRRRRWVRWTLGTVLVVVVLGVGALSLSIHLSSAPAPLALPAADAGASGASGVAAADGTWNVGPGSVAGWRAEQIVIGQESALTGRTREVWGSLTVAGGTVTQGYFTADLAALTSGLSQSSRTSVFDVTAYPTVTLVLTRPIPLGEVPAGAVEHLSAAGTLTLHGVSHAVSLSVAAASAGGGVDVLADISLPFAGWNISIQGIPWLGDLQSPATIEVLLHLTQGMGNPASVTSAIIGGPGVGYAAP